MLTVILIIVAVVVVIKFFGPVLLDILAAPTQSLTYTYVRA